MLFKAEEIQLTAPATEPLTLQDAKTQVGELTDEFNTLLLDLIPAARQYCEAVTSAILVRRTFRAYFDQFESEMWFHTTPFVSVESINYIDTDGVSQLLAADQYEVIDGEYVGLVTPAYGVAYPATRSPMRRAVTVDFTAGYDPLPDPIRVAMLLYIAELFEQRKETTVGAMVSSVPLGVRAHLAPYIRHSF